MGISLSKGQSISLAKDGGSSLQKVAVGLGWGLREVHKKGFFGFGGGIKKVEVDLDASAIIYDQSGQPVDSVWWRQLRSQEGSVVHTGDDLAGGGSDSDPNEVINVDLESVPGGVKSIVFVVNSYSGETFDGIPFAFCNVVDMGSNKEVARFNLNTQGGSARGFIIAKVGRTGSGWSFEAIGEQASGRQQTIQDIESQARQYA